MQTPEFQTGTPGRIIEPRIIALPGGAFLMGDADGRADERPVHEVVLDPFALAIYPVTNAEYAVFLCEATHAAPLDWGRPRFDHPQAPVCGVSWNDATAYAEWLSAKTNRFYHLPTEAQREYAARGGRVQQAYPWGNHPLPLEGVYARGLDGPLTGGPIVCGDGPAGANDFGLFHMADNVHEWCADYYDAGYYAQSPRHNPHGPGDTAFQGVNQDAPPRGTDFQAVSHGQDVRATVAHGQDARATVSHGQDARTTSERRSARGGSWRHDIKYARCAARSSLAPSKRFADFGFRLALTVAT